MENAIAWPETVSGSLKSYKDFNVESMEKVTTEF